MLTYSSNQIKTHEIDAVYNQANRRVEFKVPTESLYLTSLRLINLGLVVDDNLEPEELEKQQLNVLLGSLAVIKNIYLMDGRTELDKITNPRDWLSFKLSINQTNDNNISINNRAINTLWGFSSEYLPDRTAMEAERIKFYTTRNYGEPTTEAQTTPTCWLNLQAVFPLLAASNYISSSLFKDLRVVIEMDITAKETVLYTDLLLSRQPQTTTLPLLLIDEVQDEKLNQKVAKEYNTFYMAIESDSVFLPENQTNLKVSLNGFNGKYLNRIVIQKKPNYLSTVHDAFSLAINGSAAFLDEITQITLNGKQMFPFKGLDLTTAQSLLNQTWGSCNVPWGANNLYMANVEQILELPLNLTGNFHYIGFAVDDRVEGPNKFQFELTRTVDEESVITSRSARINVFGEVSKQIVANPKSQTGYLVNYV